MVNAKLIAVVLVAGVGISAFVALSTTYHSNSDTLSADSTVGEVCAMMDPELMTLEIARLCEEGDGVPLFETIGCGSEGNEVATFTFGEIITAEDVEAAFQVVSERCNPEGRRLGSGRKLNLLHKLLDWISDDYGWCSMKGSFVAGLAADSANYCDANQQCTRDGCGGPVSSCCIEHDKCLQSNEPFGRCSQTNTAGQCCDKRLSSCAGRHCPKCEFTCGWGGKKCINFWCLLQNKEPCGIKFVMGAGSNSPQAGWNTGGNKC